MVVVVGAVLSDAERSIIDSEAASPIAQGRVALALDNRNPTFLLSKAHNVVRGNRTFEVQQELIETEPPPNGVSSGSRVFAVTLVRGLGVLLRHVVCAKQVSRGHFRG